MSFRISKVFGRALVIGFSGYSWAKDLNICPRAKGYLTSFGDPKDQPNSPPEVGKGLIGLGHFVRVFLFLDRRTFVIGCRLKLRGQTQCRQNVPLQPGLDAKRHFAVDDLLQYVQRFHVRRVGSV